MDSWRLRLHKIEKRFGEIELFRITLEDLTAEVAGEEFAKDFVSSDLLRTLYELWRQVGQNVISGVKDVGALDAHLRKDLFARYNLNTRLRSYLTPMIKVFWSLTAHTEIEKSALVEPVFLGQLLDWLTPLYNCYELIAERDTIFAGCLAIVWNLIIGPQGEGRDLVRKAVGKSLGPLKDLAQESAEIFKQRFLALICVLLLVDPDDQSGIDLSNEDLLALVRGLSQAFEEPSKHCAEIGLCGRYSLDELTLILVCVAENDRSKDQLLSLELDDIIMRGLASPGLSPSHVHKAIQILHKMSFKIKTVPSRSARLVDFLLSSQQRLVGICSEMDQAIPRVVWELNHNQIMNPDVLKVCSSDAAVMSKKKLEGEKDKQHVMISYNWASKQKVLTVRDTLRARGIPVWIDIECMEGDILVAMAIAVENAAAVIICVSEKYKESPNCRSEAEYAYNLRKPIIPVMVEEGYRATGWLGIVMGTKLWYTITSEGLKNLTKIIGEIMNPDEIEEEVIQVEDSRSLSAVPPLRSLNSVDDWLLANRLPDSAKRIFQSFGMDELKYASQVEKASPGTMLSILTNSCQLDLHTAISICIALTKL